MLLGVVCLCVLDCGLEDDDEATEEGSDFLPVFDDDFWSLEDFLADWSLELRDEDLGDLLVTVEDFTEFVKDLPEEGTVITKKKFSFNYCCCCFFIYASHNKIIQIAQLTIIP